MRVIRFNSVWFWVRARRGFGVFQVALTILIAAVVGLLAFSAYGSLAAALAFSLLSALLWVYLIRL